MNLYRDTEFTIDTVTTEEAVGIELERDVEGYLTRRVVAAGGRCEKFIPEIRNGWPDRIVLLPGGVAVWVETKKPKGGKLSALQLHAHKVLRSLGQDVEVCWTKADADRIVQEYAATGA